MANKSLQTEIFDYIRKRLPANTSLPEDLSDVLGISTDSVYRRLRAETLLSVDELSLLCSHYDISFDMFLGKSRNVLFRYDKLGDSVGFEHYLSTILEDMKAIRRSENKQIIYAAIDVPIFHHFNYPELSAFKMFYWMKAVVDVDALADKKFSAEHVNSRFAQLGKEIYETYTRVPSVEIWTEDTINSLIKQIEYYWDSGNFAETEDALIVCRQAREEVETLKCQAEKSNKLMLENGPEESAFTLYYSDIEIGNNCIYTRRADNDLVYLSVHTFNKIITANPAFNAETQMWLNNLMKKSTLISGVSEKSRYRFFKTVESKIDRLYKKIEGAEGPA
jgi:uncharacterized protein (DUF1697 family)